MKFLRSACFVFLLFACIDSKTELPSRVERRIDEQEDIVSELAENVTDLFENRRRYLSSCTCLRHGCTNHVKHFACTTKFGNKANICGKRCGDRMVDFTSSGFLTPPNANIEHLPERVKESICLYKNLGPKMKTLQQSGDTSWIYFGGTDGIFHLYPNEARERDLENGDRLLSGCRPFDPRIRPWFVGASTRPKDMVLVIDISGRMDESIGKESNETRWNVTKKAVLAMLDTLASFDFVNIVTFSDSATRLGTEQFLFSSTEGNIALLKEKISEQSPRGQTNFDAAFREAFDVLTKACDKENKKRTCSECQKVILFLTEGRDTTGVDESSIAATEMLNRIEEYQRTLEEKTSGRARIFTFSMGETADDSIPRQIACANNGSWSFIELTTDPLTAMNSYYHFLTDFDQDSQPVWINPYEDDGGLGNITTVAKPVYSRGTEELDGVFLGVAALDVILDDLRAPGVTYDQVLEELFKRSKKCKKFGQTACQLQIHRNAYANKAVCVDPVTSKKNFAQLSFGEYHLEKDICLEGYRKFYKLFLEGKTWEEARSACEEDEGRLVVVETNDELALVASVSSPDGSWIGARRATSDADDEEEAGSLQMVWIDEEVSNLRLQDGSEYWGIGEPNNLNDKENCVQIDRRGAHGNLNDKNCKTQLSYICEYKTSDKCDDVVRKPDRQYFAIPSLDQCLHEEESLANARPHPYTKRLKTEDVMCSLGKHKSSFDTICCKTCNKAKDKRG